MAMLIHEANDMIAELDASLRGLHHPVEIHREVGRNWSRISANIDLPTPRIVA